HYKLFSFIPINKIRIDSSRNKKTYTFLGIIPIFTTKGNVDAINNKVNIPKDDSFNSRILINQQENLNIYHAITKNSPIKINADKTRIPIFFANNNNNVNALSVAIISILENTDSFCEFYILESDVTDSCKSKLETIKNRYGNFSIEWLKVKPQEIFKDLSVESAIGNKGFSWFSYYDIYTRFLIPDLKPSIDKALYLDYDIVVLGDIKELFEQNLGEFAIGGVSTIDSRVELLDTLAIPRTHSYFGSGVLLMDCEKLRNDNFLDKMLKIGVKYKDKLIYPDQDMLNIYFATNNYKIMDYKFCVLNGTFSEETIIQHFNGAKPWNIRSYNKNNWSEWWYYAVKSPFYNSIYKKFIENSSYTLL
ncbi:MAG: glycosyltransferase family 8 protein, partial [Rickettsiales bacterium]|nr:glycosyltransferase family 8 protein [Rickettsiales bacterium]